ncbi:hypothetical protein ACSSV1_000563 [Labrenzia sp. MBR-25]
MTGRSVLAAPVRPSGKLPFPESMPDDAQADVLSGRPPSW